MMNAIEIVMNSKYGEDKLLRKSGNINPYFIYHFAFWYNFFLD